MNKIMIIVNGHKGIAEIKWLPNSEYSIAHCSAFISVTF